MNLRRCKAATVSAGAISAACQCKCQRSAGASQAADGVSCQSGMIPRWPPPPLSPRARAGVALGSAKGGRGLRAQSRRRTQQRLVVEEGGARLAVALIIITTGICNCDFRWRWRVKRGEGLSSVRC